jgi:hypothetical protein
MWSWSPQRASELISRIHVMFVSDLRRKTAADNNHRMKWPKYLCILLCIIPGRGRRDCDRMVVGFITTYMQSVHITITVVSSKFESRPGEVYSINK